ncbi:hypothetical protein GJA_2352 [Janthinobacterium agaricidamnosum NBRC 102515 = DSM 9628]|uniref:Uncharacterized protein n=1 Tax=Janthinobacterium agaricidamnosum NBRC 102515 = DSM 9628 TaxID=1349767 RepID=W0V541_9BURK|nr:hypothetical protein GJA_2352 [Janthinobacterium agaricidamnosum NBRC 102515 = DSM 9628]
MVLYISYKGIDLYCNNYSTSTQIIDLYHFIKKGRDVETSRPFYC